MRIKLVNIDNHWICEKFSKKKFTKNSIKIDNKLIIVVFYYNFYFEIIEFLKIISENLKESLNYLE